MQETQLEHVNKWITTEGKKKQTNKQSKSLVSHERKHEIDKHYIIIVIVTVMCSIINNIATDGNIPINTIPLLPSLMNWYFNIYSMFINSLAIVTLCSAKDAS